MKSPFAKFESVLKREHRAAVMEERWKNAEEIDLPTPKPQPWPRRASTMAVQQDSPHRAVSAVVTGQGAARRVVVGIDLGKLLEPGEFQAFLATMEARGTTAGELAEEIIGTQLRAARAMRRQ